MFDALVVKFGKAAVVETGLSVAAYSVCSISMVILNKLVIDSHGFNFPASLVFFQALSAFVLVLFLKRIGVVEFPTMDRQLLIKWIPLTMLFTGMLGTSMLGLRTMSVSITLLIKNLALIMIAIGDNLLFGHYLDRWVLLSFALMILGSVVGAQQDPWVTPWGLFWNFLNVFCTTGYQLYMKGMLNEAKKSLGKWGPVYYNNMLALPPLLLPTVFAYDEWSVKLVESGSIARVWLTLMMLVGAVMTMASFWCMRMTSPTTYSVVGALNKVPLALLSMYIFDQYPNMYGALGIFCALAGGVLYTIVNVRATTDAAQKVKRERETEDLDVEKQLAPLSAVETTHTRY
ncbi:GDP-mannose transporter [Diplonema papillatum]|nr:GDP-mannose transporter [Diplonema papillatum]